MSDLLLESMDVCMGDWLLDMTRDVGLKNMRLAPVADIIMAGDPEQWLVDRGWRRPDPEHGFRLRDGTPIDVQLIQPYYCLAPYTDLREAVLVELRAWEYDLKRYLTVEDIDA